MFEYQKSNDSIIITKYTGNDTRVEVPETIERLPVSMLDAYAFSGTEVTEVALPASIERIGRYAFYNCFDLHVFTFHSSLRDIGAGAFTGCHKVRNLKIYLNQQEPTYLKDILAELPEALCVDYHCGTEYARLMFPEFYEEGVENTPARIIEHHTHGTGLHYRNCFLHRVFQFQEYDRRFPMALVQESPDFVLELVLGRLQYPFCLSDNAREAYTNYLKENLDVAARYLTAKKDTVRLSFLMDFRHRFLRVQAPTFDL